MDKIKALIIFCIFTILVTTGVLAFIFDLIGCFMELLKWLFTINMTNFGLSVNFEIFIKVLTFIISFALVAVVFNFLDIFESNIMKVAYFVISSIVGFVLSYLIYTIQANKNLIIITILVIFVMLLLFQILYFLLFKKKFKNSNMVFYHGTTLESIYKIRKNKYLKPNENGDAICLTDEIQTALTYTKYYKEIALICIKTRWWASINKKFIESRKTSDFGSINQFTYDKIFKFNTIGIKSVEYLCLDINSSQRREIVDIFTKVPLDTQKLNKYIQNLDSWQK